MLAHPTGGEPIGTPKETSLSLGSTHFLSWPFQPAIQPTSQQQEQRAKPPTDKRQTAPTNLRNVRKLQMITFTFLTLKPIHQNVKGGGGGGGGGIAIVGQIVRFGQRRQPPDNLGNNTNITIFNW